MCLQKREGERRCVASRHSSRVFSAGVIKLQRSGWRCAAAAHGKSTVRTDSHLMQLHPSFLRQREVQSTSPHTHAPRAALRRFKCQEDASVRPQRSFSSYFSGAMIHPRMKHWKTPPLHFVIVAFQRTKHRWHSGVCYALFGRLLLSSLDWIYTVGNSACGFPVINAFFILF